jgi:hypothetical protein
MRRQQESWKRAECIQGEEEEQIAEVTSKYSRPYRPYHCCSSPFFMHRPYTLRSGRTLLFEVILLTIQLLVQSRLQRSPCKL